MAEMICYLVWLLVRHRLKSEACRLHCLGSCSKLSERNRQYPTFDAALSWCLRLPQITDSGQSCPLTGVPGICATPPGKK